jgi:hypothetical protein
MAAAMKAQMAAAMENMGNVVETEEGGAVLFHVLG